MQLAIGARMSASSDPSGISSTSLPAPFNGSYSWITFSSLWAEGPELIACWVDNQRHVRLASRYLQAWEPAVDLSTMPGTVFGALVTRDSHNVTAVAKCPAGYYHVAGDMHAVPLKYMRSATAGSLTSWTTGMTGLHEASATYPQFIRAKSGTLYFWYRDGGSGDGDWYLNKWNPNTLTWSQVGRILYGSADNVSAYPHEIAVDPSSGRWHMIWTIRKDFSGPEQNENLYYAYSDDEGVTWKKTNGTGYALPITWASGEIIVALPGGAVETILNGGYTVVDTNGRPQSVWLVNDTGGVSRYRHVWLDGVGAWHFDTLLPTVNASSRLPSLHIWPDGRRWMIFQTSSGGRGSKLRYLDIDTQAEVILRDADMLHHTPVTAFARDRNVLYLLAPYEQQDGVIGTAPADLANQINVPVIAAR